MPESIPPLPDLGQSLRVAVLRHELSDAQSAVLGFLFRDGPLTPGALSELERVKPPSMNRTINCLVDAGYVTREAAPDDGRRVLVTLTGEGRAVVDETRRRRDAWLVKRLAELPADERRVVADAARILRGIADR
jgi:DNA-binding MarR family transcriptional regulator